MEGDKKTRREGKRERTHVKASGWSRITVPEIESYIRISKPRREMEACGWDQLFLEGTLYRKYQEVSKNPMDQRLYVFRWWDLTMSFTFFFFASLHSYYYFFLIPLGFLRCNYTTVRFNPWKKKNVRDDFGQISKRQGRLHQKNAHLLN